MRELLVTQQQYLKLKGVGGGLLLVALRIFGGAIISFMNAFLAHSYLGWGFYFPAFFPAVFLCLGILYVAGAVLLFKHKQAFLLLYLICAMIAIALSAVSGGFGFLLYVGLEILIVLYLFRSKRAAVAFDVRKIVVVDMNYGVRINGKP